MAIAYETATSYDITWPSGGAAQDVSFDAGSGDNRFMAVFASNRDVSLSHFGDSDFSYNSVTMTAFGAQFGTAVAGRGYWLKDTSLPNSGAATLSTDMTQDFPTDVEGIVTAAVYNGVDQTTAHDGYTTAAGIDSTAEVTITSATNDVPVIMTGWRTFNSTTFSETATDDFTERWLNHFNDHAQHGGEGVGAASVTLTSTDDEAAQIAWIALGFNLNVASAGAAAGPLLYGKLVGRGVLQGRLVA